jgi:hypothetical protein
VNSILEVGRRQRAFCAAVCALLLAGCASHYDLTLTNGDVIRARTKPTLNEQGHYVFKDLTGQEASVNRMRVRQIEPVRRGSRPAAAFN